MMNHDDRPSTSIWGTVLSSVEVGLMIYQVVAERGSGVMVKSDIAEKTPGIITEHVQDGAGQDKNGYYCYEQNSPEAESAMESLEKAGLLHSPDTVNTAENDDLSDDFFEYDSPFDDEFGDELEI